MINSIDKYYKEIIEIILELYAKDLEKNIPGHCMKISGLGLKESCLLWELINEKHDNVDTFVISEKESDHEMFISATKLIEYRNNQTNPLLVIIPSNSRTAAEDSYGNATFKEISLKGVENQLKRKLIKKIPIEYKSHIENDIIKYLDFGDDKTTDIIYYLLELENQGYTKNNIGNLLGVLGLIPDKNLLLEKEKIRSRLNFNNECIKLLTEFNRPLYDRISDLPLKTNSIQKQIIQFLKDENNVRNEKEICDLILRKYPSLNFANWDIPDLDFEHVKLIVEDIKSKNLKIEAGRRILESPTGSTSKLKIRFSTQPPAKDIIDLKYFRVVLMAVDGESGEEISDLRKAKNSYSNRPYREVTVELNSSMIDEGSYFLKVVAEDEHGNTLNYDDDFKEHKIHQEYLKIKAENEETQKSDFPYKLTCDSDDFDFIVEDEIDVEDNQKKDKLHNVLQAYFKYRIDLFKNGEDQNIPEPVQNSNHWLQNKSRHNAVFYISYSNKHNYQINVSEKLKIIEEVFLNHDEQFGYITARLHPNTLAQGYDYIEFVDSDINNIVPVELRKARSKLFRRIKNSNDKNTGIFESCDLFNCKKELEDYLFIFRDWISKLDEEVNNPNLSDEGKVESSKVLIEFQLLDLTKIRVKLPNGEFSESLLMSPLHPLRLSWHLNLMELFDNWEIKTLENPNYVKTWSNNLDKLFDGDITVTNNPLVFVDSKNIRGFSYAGELSFGWGLYLDVIQDEHKAGMTSLSRQMKYYLREQFNIAKSNYVDSEVNQKLVLKHIQNYLLQHPYADKLIINLFNAGDTDIFANTLIELEKDKIFTKVKYEIRLFKGEENIVDHGKSLKELINPESTVSEEAEAFSQPSRNRLFPKLRFSINSISDYLKTPSRFTSHLSFLISPFPITIELIKPINRFKNFYLNGVIVDSNISTTEDSKHIKWNRYVTTNKLQVKYGSTGQYSIDLFNFMQSFIAGSLASKPTNSIPSTQLRLSEKDKVLLSHLHDNSDWVITFDKNLGPQIFDQPSRDGRVPFLLDYIPGEEVSGISSYLTTRPTSEIIGLLGPHFEEFDLDVHSDKDKERIKILLEDLRAVSSSLVLQLNSSKNKAFEVIGSAFTKRVLEKKEFLNDSFLLPIDLHRNLFEKLPTESKSRADNLLLTIDTEKREILITVIEIKCRKSIGNTEKIELKEKMVSQIRNTITALRSHFDPEFEIAFDRLDRELKNKEFKSLLTFYIERAYRYEYLEEKNYFDYLKFLQTLDDGFSLKFKKLGLIYDFSASKKHSKEELDDITFFTFGKGLITEILDPDSDLNTRRLEDGILNNELEETIGYRKKLIPILEKVKSHIMHDGQNTPTTLDSSESDISSSIPKVENEIDLEQKIDLDNSNVNAVQEYTLPKFDILIGKSGPSAQFGILGESNHGKKIAIDISGTNTISLFGVQGGGKSYTIGSITEMVLKQFSSINKLPSPLAGVIFHYSESIDYEPEFTSMIYPNDEQSELAKLKERYGANPDRIEDIIILTPRDKIEERQEEFPSVTVLPIAFNSQELNIQDWMFLLGAIGNDSTYIKQLKSIMKQHRRNITIDAITQSVEDSELLSNSQKALARQKLSFAREYIDDDYLLRETLNPGRLIIVDLRDEFIVKDEALGLFVIMLNIFSSVKKIDNKHFNKFIVFDEAHKYMNNKDLTNHIVTAIREMRHKGVSIMIASQDPPSLPNEIIELSSVVLLHKFNSPQWLKHVQKSITQLSALTSNDMSTLTPGEGFLWSTKATEKGITHRPIKISTRPRVTKHGGGTIQATGNT
ncbi:methylation-associated defense system ATP-binding protein MAD8 [Aestuariivivens sediminis]|uniref:methylation-associated defense system ATP-binding protein MAD8 n=1 Tax=Aestuariivivens sediminis TaxID=2913557 RepID=UPI001F587A89|nr:ATP-binding protein [Aestuariivivens sediminis]